MLSTNTTLIVSLILQTSMTNVWCSIGSTLSISLLFILPSHYIPYHKVQVGVGEGEGRQRETSLI
jgi:hypothetical protein